MNPIRTEIKIDAPIVTLWKTLTVNHYFILKP